MVVYVSDVDIEIVLVFVKLWDVDVEICGVVLVKVVDFYEVNVGIFFVFLVCEVGKILFD